MELALSIFQIIVAVLLAAVILLQAQSSGLSSTFGGAGGIYHSKRGSEKFLFIATIVLAVIFLVLSITALLIRK